MKQWLIIDCVVQHLEVLTEQRCVPGDGSKHAGDCRQADFEGVQLTHDHPLQFQTLQVLQT